jgi:tetratricopeptide (TPR) repeat protein
VGPSIDQGANEEVAKWAHTVLAAEPRGPEAAEAQIACLSWTAGALAHDGQHALAESLLDRAESTLQTLAGAELWAVLRFHYAKAILSASCGRLVKATREFELALAASDEAGDARTSCGVRVELSTSWMELGQPERAEELIRRALADSKQRSLATIEGFTLPALANVMIRTGRLDEAEPPLAETVELGNKAGSNWVLGLASLVWSALSYARHDWAEAERKARDAVKCFRGNRGPLPAALSALARALLAQGKTAEAFEAAREATDILEELGGTEFFESFVRLMIAETAMAVGDRSRARDAIGAARDRILQMAEQIAARDIRASFLSVAENARTLELAKAWAEAS